MTAKLPWATVAVIIIVAAIGVGVFFVIPPEEAPPVTITVWTTFENKIVPEDRSYVKLNDELKIDFNSPFSPIEYKITLRYNTTTENLIENQIDDTSGFYELKCIDLGLLRISADGTSRAIEVLSAHIYDLKEIEENALRAQEEAASAQRWNIILATIIVILTAINIILTHKVYKKKGK